MYPSLQTLGVLLTAAVIVIVVIKILDFNVRKPRAKNFGDRIFIACIQAPLLEETIFRFPILLVLACGGSDQFLNFAIITSSIIFGIPHVLVLSDVDFGGSIAVFSLTTFAGLTLCWLVVTTGSILPAVIVHAVYNFAVHVGAVIAEEFR
ncbi:MAG: hypothetical protein G01um101419_20 [Parcubacteria group bacterium Gr01-1014_19]|nr:MAG: hypothetical protein G01um101419_20 [Parcubacteria group bacterium Gr01-1014_19]